MDHPDADHPLGSLPPDADPPRSLEQRITRTLLARGLLRPRPSGLWQRAAAGAAALAVLALGYAIGAATRDAPPPAPAGARYALLLYEDDRFDTTRPQVELVREYTAWAAQLRERGRLVTGAQLVGPERRLVRGADSVAVEPGAIRSDAGALTGMFVIRPESEADAMAIALSCPHLSYGGTVAVRPIAGP